MAFPYFWNRMGGMTDQSRSGEKQMDRLLDEAMDGLNMESRDRDRRLQCPDIINTADKFALTIDANHYRPEELKVSATGRELTVEGRHEEQSDEHGFIQRSFVRKLRLPNDVNADMVESEMSPEGMLTVKAVKRAIQETPSRVIPIQKQ